MLVNSITFNFFTKIGKRDNSKLNAISFQWISFQLVHIEVCIISAGLRRMVRRRRRRHYETAPRIQHEIRFNRKKSELFMPGPCGSVD